MRMLGKRIKIPFRYIIKSEIVQEQYMQGEATSNCIARF